MLFSSIARALVKNIGNAVGYGIAGSVIVDIWDGWNQSKADKQKKLAEIEMIAGMSQAAAKQQATDAVREVAADRSEAEQQALVAFLTQVPNTIRQSQRRPSDPSGQTLSSALRLNGPQDLARLLPQRGPRFKVGDRPIVGGDWELEELLGMGGFGEVWKAKNPNLPYSVAFKFCVDSEAAKMLRNEAKVVVRVMQQGKQQGIVQLRNTYLSAEVPFLEYDLVTGGDLTSLAHRSLHRHKGQLPIDWVTKIMRNMVRGVRFAHRLTPPIVHRDLKPANVLVQPRGEGKFELRIADFGIGGAAATRALEQNPTQETTTSVIGTCTPLYASPQQIRGEEPDPRDDVHALGVIWYQLLVGDLNSPVGIEWREQLGERQVPQAIIKLIGRCVSPKADKRPADAAVLDAEIDKLSPLRLPPRPPLPSIGDRGCPHHNPGPWTKNTRKTDPKASVCCLRPVTNVRVIKVENAMYRGANLTGSFELADQSGLDPINFTPGGKITVEVVCLWHGAISHPSLKLTEGKYELEDGYSGNVVANIGRVLAPTKSD